MKGGWLSATWYGSGRGGGCRGDVSATQYARGHSFGNYEGAGIVKREAHSAADRVQLVDFVCRSEWGGPECWMTATQFKEMTGKNHKLVNELKKHWELVLIDAEDPVNKDLLAT